MNLQEKIQADLTEAMKAGDELRRETLRMVLATLRNREIELKKALIDEEIIDVLRKEGKKREEAADIFLKNNRTALAEKEKKEIEVIARYLPAMMSEGEARAIVQKILGGLREKNIGVAMKAAMGELRGKADASLVAKIVKEELSQQ